MNKTENDNLHEYLSMVRWWLRHGAEANRDYILEETTKQLEHVLFKVLAQE